ncbi:hypothetical protein Acr_00g0040030 [Actinidia rufa]|uniref:PWWP domain-containing protein n=1 Tax=Actinidia rufa TaxID=165716 RepID=A0A7J0DJH8_9ERIC|nr:hypothetical protein Acr_00g0040030 [Actinidia rufa]
MGESENEDDMGDEEREYLVGDYVWGKIRSHPWCPGQFFLSFDVSEYARKCNQCGLLLAAYFGDRNFSWCFQSQLKPFAENFEEKSKQSTSKSFVNAVQKSIDEIGRLVELKMTCSCIPEENRIGLDRLLVTNAGIKKRVLVPEGNLSRLPVPLPFDLLLTLRSIAEVVSVINMLELTVLRSSVSAYYKANGGHKLVHTWKTVIRTGCTTEGRRRRRRASQMTSCTTEDAVGEPKKNKKVSEVEDVTTPVKLVSTSAKKKRKSSDEALSQDDGDFTSPSGKKREKTEKKVLSTEKWWRQEEIEKADASGKMKKRDKSLESVRIAEKKVSSAKNGGREGEKETKKKSKVSSFGNDDTASASRERKKSKYLSLPFTSLKHCAENSGSGRDLEAESVKIAKLGRLGEQMSRAAGQLIRSPLVENPSDGTFQAKSSKKLDTKCLKYGLQLVNPLCLREKFGRYVQGIRLCSEFGAVNENETEVFDDSPYARIVFGKASDAEEAFNELIKKSPYGDANVKYRLRYSPIPSLSSVKPADNEKLRSLFVVKEKLEKMTRMLENSDKNMEPEMKLNFISSISLVLLRIRMRTRMLISSVASVDALIMDNLFLHCLVNVSLISFA